MTNVGTQAIVAPYVMHGFPDFGNQHQTSLLGNDHTSIRMQPGDLKNRARDFPTEQILLRQVMGDGPQGLQGSPLRSVAHFGDEGARLTGTFTPTALRHICFEGGFHTSIPSLAVPGRTTTMEGVVP